MKTSWTVCAALWLLLVSGMGAVPVEEGQEKAEGASLHEEPELFQPFPGGEKFLSGREGRGGKILCDMATPGTSWGAVNRYCAKQCTKLSERYKGGFCGKGVCVCTK